MCTAMTEQHSASRKKENSPQLFSTDTTVESCPMEANEFRPRLQVWYSFRKINILKLEAGWFVFRKDVRLWV